MVLSLIKIQQYNIWQKWRLYVTSIKVNQCTVLKDTASSLMYGGIDHHFFQVFANTTCNVAFFDLRREHLLLGVCIISDGWENYIRHFLFVTGKFAAKI